MLSSQLLSNRLYALLDAVHADGRVGCERGGQVGVRGGRLRLRCAAAVLSATSGRMGGGLR